MVILKFKADFDYASKDPKLCALGEYSKKTFVVLYVGSHPCVYVECDNDMYHCDDTPDNCPAHFGFTFYDNLLRWEGKIKNIDSSILRKNYIGWDYNHYGDYTRYYIEGYYTEDTLPHKWTTDDLIACAINVIDWMNENNIK